ncbi:MAG: DUF2461 domain-containing protein [Pyrinomonadaceae bacterium]
MIAKHTIDFLKKLNKNNNRDWFKAKKPEFQKSNDNVIAFTGDLIAKIAKFDPEVAGLDPKTCVFRIYRDVRFSKDKSPYKTNLGAYISPGGRKSMAPGYYMHIQPGRSFIAAGKYMPDSAELLKIRNAIATRTKDFKKLVDGKKFKDRFGELYGDRLRTAPKGFSPDHEAIEYLKLKGFMAYLEFPDDESLISAEFSKVLAATARAAYPLVAFLRTALRNQ